MNIMRTKATKMETSKKAEVAKPAMAAKPVAANSAVKMKKDGTPDKRYKTK